MPIETKAPHPWELQLVAMGMLIANKELRKQVAETDFIDRQLQAATEELQGKLKPPSWSMFPEFLRQLGVEWKLEDGDPIPAIISRLKLDTEYHRAVNHVNEMAMLCEVSTDEAKRKFIEMLKGYEASGRLGSSNSESE